MGRAPCRRGSQQAFLQSQQQQHCTRCLCCTPTASSAPTTSPLDAHARATQPRRSASPPAYHRVCEAACGWRGQESARGGVLVGDRCAPSSAGAAHRQLCRPPHARAHAPLPGSALTWAVVVLNAVPSVLPVSKDHQRSAWGCSSPPGCERALPRLHTPTSYASPLRQAAHTHLWVAAPAARSSSTAGAAVRRAARSGCCGASPAPAAGRPTPAGCSCCRRRRPMRGSPQACAAAGWHAAQACVARRSTHGAQPLPPRAPHTQIIQLARHAQRATQGGDPRRARHRAIMRRPRAQRRVVGAGAHPSDNDGIV